MPNAMQTSPDNEASPMDLQGAEAISLDFSKGLDYYIQKTNEHVSIEYLELVHNSMSNQLDQIKAQPDDSLISSAGGTPKPTKMYRRAFSDLRKACGLRLQTLKGTTSKRKAKKDPKSAQADKSFTMSDFPELPKAEPSLPQQEFTHDPEGEFIAPKRVCRPSSPVATEVPTKNTFEDLEEETMDAQVPEQARPKPPPLIIDAPESSTELLKELSELNGEKLIATLATGKLKVRARDYDAHSLLQSHLLEKGICFFSYTAKAKKPAKYVLKRVPSNTEPEAIAEELEALGFKPEKVSLLYKPTAAKFPPPFVIAMNPAGEHRAITEIKKILYYRVQIEKLRRRKGPTICYKCLARGHTSHQCNRKDVCPRCGLNHKLSDCTRTAEEVPTCYRCKTDGHSGRDLSCPKLKSIRKRKEAPVRATTHPRPASDRNASRSKKTFADVAAGRQAAQKEAVVEEQVRTDGTLHMEAVPSFQKAYAAFKALPAGPARLEALLDAYASLFLVIA